MRLLQYIWMIGMIIGTVLSSSHEGYLYIGCYGNVFTGCKSNGIIQDINVEKCDKQCTGYVYIAIYNGKSCYCCNDDNFSISNKITASNCNKACPGDLQSLCGGTGAYKSYTSLYSRRNDKTISLETINIYTTTTQIMEISTKIETQTTTILPSPITTTHIVPCPSSANVETLTTTQMMEISTKIETQTTTILPSPITTTHIVPCPSPTQLQLCPTPAISVSSMVFSLNATKPIVSTKNVDGLTVQKSKACNYVIVVTDLNAQASEAASSITNALLVPKTNISAFKASKSSTPDDRLSAQAIGYSGLMLFILPFMFIVCFDLVSFLKLRKRTKFSAIRNVKSEKTRITGIKKQLQ